MMKKVRFSYRRPTTRLRRIRMTRKAKEKK